MSWWELTLKAPLAEELAATLFDLGAAGVTVVNSSELLCYFDEQEAGQLEKFRSRSVAFGFSLEACKGVADKNWVQIAGESWREFNIDGLRVVPVLDGADSPPAPHDNRTIFVRPGLGFGTGHHATTSSVIALLQDGRLSHEKVATVLDAGTGSGILAIAAARLFHASTRSIDACDTDASALDNARENAALNGLTGRINFTKCALQDVTGSYDLVMANVYAEVLVAAAPVFEACVRPSGHLILSGIMPKLLQSVIEAFGQGAWRRVESLERENWCTLLYSRL